MFSYLHGIRPGNRRSAVPPSTALQPNASSRYHHEASTYNSSSSTGHILPGTSHIIGNHESSPVSPAPPVLPPILRVTTGYESYEAVQTGSSNHEERLVLAMMPEASRQEASLKLTDPTHSSGNLAEGIEEEGRRYPPKMTGARPLSQVPERPRPAVSRGKRPIDRAFENMQAYREPPRRQGTGHHSEGLELLQRVQTQPPLPTTKALYRQSQSPQQHSLPPQRQAPIPPGRASEAEIQTTTQKSQGKNKFNLLNPMSLLVRRRSAQAVEQAYLQDQRASGLRLPDDYDPRIRGKLIHDFSAPRGSRPISANEGNIQMLRPDQQRDKLKPLRSAKTSISEGESPNNTEREHTPIFKENFEDDFGPWSEDLDSPAKRKSSAFLYQASLHGLKTVPNPASLPAFARNLPSNLLNSTNTSRQTSSPPSKGSLEVLMELPLPHQKPARSSPPNSSSSSQSRSTSINDSMSQNLGSPQRFKSNASRFSFDLAGVGSVAQEKLLEEKHRQHAKKMEQENRFSVDVDAYDEDDTYDEFNSNINDEEDDGGFEEKVPGVNADAEDVETPALAQLTDNLNSVTPNKSSFESAASQISTGLTSPSTTRNSQGRTSSLVASKVVISSVEPESAMNTSSKEDIARPKSTPGLRSDSGLQVHALQRETASESNLAGLPQRHEQDEHDDMYFDDGMIDDFGDGDYQPFDESVFDDDTSRVYGLPLRDLRPLSDTQRPIEYDASRIAGTGDDLRITNQLSEPDISFSAQESMGGRDHSINEKNDTIADPTQISNAPLSKLPTGLTQDNLGLHDKLASAANQAALDGKFNRTCSQSSVQGFHGDAPPSLGIASNHLDHVDRLFYAETDRESTDFAYDDAHIAFTESEEDDPIIAAANAEALENDDDGFYGQEFGFFARASSSSESEYVNGGYFGPRNIEGIHRMNSGRDNFREPSLTPITERSEWSNRNSVVSLAMHGYPLSSQYQSNPQLMDLLRVEEGEEMSMEALRKLRRGAWGGSNASLQSSSNSQNSGSPLNYVSPGIATIPMIHATNSNGSIVSPGNQNMGASFSSFSSSNDIVSSNDSDASLIIDDTTITLSQSQPGLVMQPMAPPARPPPRPPTESSPIQRSVANTPWTPGHKRNSSGAESVSYREEGGKWFVEKTRVLEETGEIEVLERSVIENGRI